MDATGSPASMRPGRPARRTDHAPLAIEYRTILELASDPISVRDADGWFVEVNEAACRNLGYPREAYLELHVTDVAPAALNPGLPKRLARLHAGETVVGTRKLRRRDGTIIEVENSSQLLPGGYILTISRDLTERRRRDEERRRLLTAVEQTEESVAMVDALGNVAWVNPAFCRFHGIALEDIVGRRPSAFASPIDPSDRTSAEIVAAMAAGRPWSGTVRRRRADGRLVELGLGISPIRGEQDRVVGWVEIGRDISRELALEDQLRQAQKMEAVGRLAGGIAHDFNNLLAAIRGFAELIHVDAPAGGETHEMSGEIVRAADRGKVLAARLLTFARQRPEEPVVVDLGRLVEEAAPLLAQVADQRARLSMDLAPEPLCVRVDPVSLEQALVNLVINARDAIRDTGTIVVSTRLETVGAEHRAAASGLLPGTYARLAVADSGDGIPADVLPHVFEPFFTTKPLNQGTGLGLSIVYAAVMAAGGRILVDSAPGAGARFSVYLPLAAGAAEPATDRGARGRTTGGGLGTVLLVDDEPAILEVARRMLERAGHRVETASSAETALALLDAGGLRPAVLVTDILLPGTNGIGLAEAVRRRIPGVAVLFISGYEGDRIAGDAARGQGTFLQKPFRAEELVRAVGAAAAASLAR